MENASGTQQWMRIKEQTYSATSLEAATKTRCLFFYNRSKEQSVLENKVISAVTDSDSASLFHHSKLSERSHSYNLPLEYLSPDISSLKMQTLNIWSYFAPNTTPNEPDASLVVARAEPPKKRARQDSNYVLASTTSIAPPGNIDVQRALVQQLQQQQAFQQSAILPLSTLVPSKHPQQPQQHMLTSTFAASTAAAGDVIQDAEVNDRKRKQINALHAKKARERKKNLMATLEMEQAALQEENRRLRALIKTHLPNNAQTIIGECSYKPRARGMFHGASSSKLCSSDFDLIETLTVGKQSFVLSNPRLPDNPIVYASCSFLKMTGYHRDQVIGRNCRFLQGIHTESQAVDKVREATKTGNDVSVNLLNYKADGTPFWNHLFVAALRDQEGNVVNYVGVQSEIDDPNIKKEGEVEEKDLKVPGPPQVEKLKSVFSSSSAGEEERSSTPIDTKSLNKEPAPCAVTSTALDLAKSLSGRAVAGSGTTEQPQNPTLTNTCNQWKQAMEDAALEPAETTATTNTTPGKSATRVKEQALLLASIEDDPIDVGSNSEEVIITNVKEQAMDWAHLAEVLEFDFGEAEDWMKEQSVVTDGMEDTIDSGSFFDCLDEADGTNSSNDITSNNGLEETKSEQSFLVGNDTEFDDTQKRERGTVSCLDVDTSSPEEIMIHRFSCQSPRQYVTRTLRSELIDALMTTHGDVTDPRFMSALDVLSSMFKSTCNYNTSTSNVLNGSWKSISRPSFHHGGCLGKNENQEFVYTLGKMTFSMFKPGNLRCTVQHTMNTIEPVCQMDKHPNAAPWSLRRELALSDDNNTPQNTMLKSYDISIALTIEPGRFGAKSNEVVPSPPRRLRALQTVRGYFLPDPDTPNRLTVWFTGGQLAPVSPPELHAEVPDPSFGELEEWIALFGAEHKKTWGESLANLGAQLFLGAELPEGMEADGSMAYALHRPFGGHGKGYVDVLYVDDELLITQGNSKTVHVMTIKK